jgi:hypothetical protein
MQTGGFLERWITWIRNLLISSSSSVKLNGEEGTHFFHIRDLRQGDPLSPMLCIVTIATAGGTTQPSSNARLQNRAPTVCGRRDPFYASTPPKPRNNYKCSRQICRSLGPPHEQAKKRLCTDSNPTSAHHDDHLPTKCKLATTVNNISWPTPDTSKADQRPISTSPHSATITRADRIQCLDSWQNGTPQLHPKRPPDLLHAGFPTAPSHHR